MTEGEKLTLLFVVDDTVFGYALRNHVVDEAMDRSFAKAQIATGAYPRLKQAFLEAGARLDENRFDIGLQALLRAVREKG